jgi:hypothetical protein
VGVENLIPETTWVPGTAWTTVMNGFIGTTSGGPLVIRVHIPVTATRPGLFGCQPTVDGIWAGSYAFPQVTAGNSSAEGVVSAVRPWGAAVTSMAWSTSRVYASIPAGPHQFAVQCATNSDGSFVGTTGSMLSLSVIEFR